MCVCAHVFFLWVDVCVCVCVCVFTLQAVCADCISELWPGKVQQTESGQSTCCYPSGQHTHTHTHTQCSNSKTNKQTHSLHRTFSHSAFSFCYDALRFNLRCALIRIHVFDRNVFVASVIEIFFDYTFHVMFFRQSFLCNSFNILNFDLMLS